MGALASGNGFGGIFGGNQAATTAAYVAGECADPHVSKDMFWQQNVAIQKEIGRIDYESLKHNYELYIGLNDKITSLATKQAQYDSALPLAMELAKVNAERYADNKINTVSSEMLKGFGAVEYQLAHKINGTLGLPWSDIITGIPQMPNCSFDVTCGKATS